LNHILEDYSFKLNSLSGANDPYEYIKRYASVGGGGNYDKRFETAMNIVENILPNKIKRGCFVADEGDDDNYKTWTSILNAPLWAHYGGNNEGAAIVFDSKSLLDACKAHIDHPWALHADRVTYPMVLDFNDDPSAVRLDDIGVINDINVAKYLFDKASKFWFKKGHQWAHENEYRVMLFNEEVGSTMIEIKDSIKAIVFGEKVSHIVQNAVGDYCNKQGIKVLVLRYNDFENHYYAEDIFQE
jgi:hypothetical protein